MDAFPSSLWDLLPERPRAAVAPAPPQPVTPCDQPARPKRTHRQAEYDALVMDMKREHGIRIHRWRKRTSGCAWVVKYDDGRTSRLIESPYPRGPVSCAVFLHEVGHHAIGFYTYKPRCLEEYMAWQWSLATMRERGLPITPPVERRYDLAMRYAVAKALRRGIKRLPAELAGFLPEPRLVVGRMTNDEIRMTSE